MNSRPHQETTLQRSITSRRRALSTAAAAAALAFGAAGVAGCGAGSDPAGASAGGEAGAEASYGRADVAFLTGMIPHHSQAVKMVGIADGREVSAPVEELMAQIKAAQEPEIEQMRSLLKQWGEPVPVGASMDGMGGMGWMPGMMTGARMTELRTASDAEFETLWLEMMVEHHQGAIAQARTQLAEGRDGRAIALAEQIEKAQAAEIDAMQRLLRR